METEETNTTKAPEIHYRDFQFELAHNCNEAISNLAPAVEINTKAIEQNGKAMTEMVNLMRKMLEDDLVKIDQPQIMYITITGPKKNHIRKPIPPNHF